ncbi:hypothetical protein [Cupriavidus necator]|uniref:hypothetical protein n=1 Tax=Cupriavidus necator TaxID=106590 RepID=UPI003F735D8E
MYSGVTDIFSRYWQAYGGWPSLVRSPYFHAAVLLTALTAHTWSQVDWWNQVLSILPNLLGFTIGGFTLFLAIGSDRFRAILSARDDDEPASMMELISASYVHFIVVQTLAIICALLASATNFPTPSFLITWINGVGLPAETIITTMRLIGWGGSYLLFLYALALVVAACMVIFRTSRWAELHDRGQR